MPHYDGNDEEEQPKEVIVNPVEVQYSKKIVTTSNEAPAKFKETSKEQSVRRQTSPDVRIQCSSEITASQSDIHVTSMAEVIPNAKMTLMGEIQHAVVQIIPDSEHMEEGKIEATKL